MRWSLWPVLVLAVVVSGPGVALAGKCSSGEAKATGKKASCKAGVFSKAASKNLAPDPAKLAACDSKFSASYSKAQSADDCSSAVTAGAEETKVDNFVNDVNTEIAVGPLPSKCQGAKLKAAGKNAGCQLGVQAKALAKSLQPDGGKLQACKDKFAAAFGKAEGGATCGTAANGTTIENKVDAFVADIVDDVNPPATTTTSTTHAPTTTTSSTTSTTTSSTTTTTLGSGCTQASTNRPFSVSFAVPDSSVIVQGLTLLIDYPETRVTIPGSGAVTTVRQAIINVQSGALSSPFDLDTSLREQIAGTAAPLTPGMLFTINFFDCLGATPPTAADFTCAVQVASDPLGQPDTGVTCSVGP